MGSWAWEVAWLDGTPRGELQVRSAAVSRRLNAAGQLEVEVDALAAGDIRSTARLIRGWRTPNAGGARTLRSAVKVAQIAAEASTDTLERARIFGEDGAGVHGRRLVQSAVEYTGDTPAEILEARITAQNSRADTGLSAVVTGTGGPTRDRTYDAGKLEGEILQQLAEVDDGFYWRSDPTDAGGTITELVMLYPEAGSSSTARLGWGAGTDGNVSGVTGEVRTPTNSVLGFGAGDGDEQLRVIRNDTASIEALGLYDGAVTHADVIEQATLGEHALDALRVFEPRVFRVTVSAPVGASKLYVPEPWEDFDVGDTVQLNLRGVTAALQYQGRALVQAFTVTVDADGVERLMSIDLAEL